VAILKKYNLRGEEVGQVNIDDSLLQASANPQMIKDYLVALRANQRQWSANTKTRAQVSHSGQKPHPQKGTGRARQGYLGAPQYKGGGRAFGPKPKFDQHVRINKKERQAAIKYLISQKLQGQNLHILQCDALSQPKTKVFVDFLKSRNLFEKRVLFVGESLISAQTQAGGNGQEIIVKSLRNVPKLSFSALPNMNGYDVVLHQDIVILDSAFDQFLVMLGGKK
jgi:large subunit ribosomal protein L4